MSQSHAGRGGAFAADCLKGRTALITGGGSGIGFASRRLCLARAQMC